MRAQLSASKTLLSVNVIIILNNNRNCQLSRIPITLLHFFFIRKNYSFTVHFIVCIIMLIWCIIFTTNYPVLYYRMKVTLGEHMAHFILIILSRLMSIDLHYRSMRVNIKKDEKFTIGKAMSLNSNTQKLVSGSTRSSMWCGTICLSVGVTFAVMMSKPLYTCVPRELP